MKKYSIVALILATTLSHSATAQPVKTKDWSGAIKNYDISKLWTQDSISVDSQNYKMPEPLGIFGGDYQRFYIHYLSVIKSKEAPNVYLVKGKTRLKKNITPFSGTITIKEAFLYKDKNGIDSPGLLRGIAKSECRFYEDSTLPSSGYIVGELKTLWYLDQQQIHYDALEMTSDGYANNQFTGKWTSYKTHVSKKCNWGDYRIPGSGDLDCGAGEFVPGTRYLSKGWKNYFDAFVYGDSLQQAGPRAIEASKWWNQPKAN